MRATLGLLLAVAALGLAGNAPAQDRVTEARENYEALRDGRKQLSQLSHQQVQDVIDWQNRMRLELAKPAEPTPKEQCIDDEVDRYGSEPSEAAMRAIELKCSPR